jgi:hypothetical protein
MHIIDHQSKAKKLASADLAYEANCLYTYWAHFRVGIVAVGGKISFVA